MNNIIETISDAAKKLVILLAFLIGVSQAHAVIWTSQSFLSGKNVFVPTNVVSSGVLFGDTNVLYTSQNGAIVLSFTNNVGGSNTWGGAFNKAVNIFPNAFGDENKNIQVMVILNNTNAIPTTNMSRQVPFPITGNGYPLIGAFSTNLLTINLVNLPDGTNAATTGDTWSFTVLPNGTNMTIMSTNIPNGFLLGTPAWRVSSLTISTNSAGGPIGNGNGILVNDIRFISATP